MCGGGVGVATYLVVDLLALLVVAFKVTHCGELGSLWREKKRLVVECGVEREREGGWGRQCGVYCAVVNFLLCLLLVSGSRSSPDFASALFCCSLAMARQAFQ